VPCADDDWYGEPILLPAPHEEPRYAARCLETGTIASISRLQDISPIWATSFPSFANGAPKDFAVLKVDAEEADTEWRSGFYRVDADLMELNTVLLHPGSLIRSDGSSLP